MNNLEVRFQAPWLLMLIIPGIFFIVVSYLKMPAPLKKAPARLLLLAFRLTAVLLLAALASGMTFVMDGADTALVILADCSQSVSGAEETVLTCTEELSDLAAEAGIDAQTVYFGANSARERDGVNAEATDIAQALRFAANALPDDRLGHVVLISDGLQTDGDALAAASVLGGRDIRVDAIAVKPTSAEREAQVSTLVLSESAALGKPFTARVDVRSTFDGRATLRLYDGDALMKEAAVGVFEGDNTFSYTLTQKMTGTSVYSVELDMEGDACWQNNRAYAVLNGTGSAAVLLVEGQPGQSALLKQLLQKHGYRVDCVAAAEMPSAFSALCEYGLVVLMNTDVRGLPSGMPAMLEEYVSVYGRSVLTTGGDSAYLLGGMQDTAFEQFLPITMAVEEKESAEPVALMLLIDNSASMEGTAIVMAKRGAVKSIRALNDNDFVGVITFSTEHSVLSELKPVTEKDEVIAAISGLGTVMGTRYNGALGEAYAQLAAFEGASRKHVILISDGNPSDTGYASIVEQMAGAGITVSTIAMGREVSADIMESIAAEGNGHCYLVKSSYDLPNVMMTDTVLLKVEYKVPGSFFPAPVLPFHDLPDALPALEGYVRATAKPSADVVLTAPNEHPLYVEWVYGKGMAASFMSDMSAAWSSQWFADARGQSAMLEMIRRLMPETHAASALSLTLVQGGSQGLLRVKSADQIAGQSFSATVATPGGDEYQVAFVPGDDGCYERLIPLDGQGKYSVVLHQRGASGELLSVLETAVAASWSPEYEAFDVNGGEALLLSVCETGGGALLNSAQAVINVEMQTMRIVRDPSLFLAIAVFFLVMLDFALRRSMPCTKRITR